MVLWSNKVKDTTSVQTQKKDKTMKHKTILYMVFLFIPISILQQNLTPQRVLSLSYLLLLSSIWPQTNLLFFLALTNLSPVPVYQVVTNQGKLLTTAIISGIMLKRQIKVMQYLAITLLGMVCDSDSFSRISQHHKQ